MSIRSFVQAGMHFGKLGERKSDAFGVIELYDIGESDTVGAFYTSDRSLQAHSVAWYADLKLPELLAKHVKSRSAEEQQIHVVERPRIGQKPSLADELRRASHRDDKWVKPDVPKATAAAGENPGDAELNGAKRTRTARTPSSRTPRSPKSEPVDIPKGADAQLKAWAAQHGACKAIRLLVHAHPTMNRVSVVELARQCNVHKTTAGVQYLNAKRDISAGRTEGDDSKKAKGAANKSARQAKKDPVPIDPASMLKDAPAPKAAKAKAEPKGKAGKKSATAKKPAAKEKPKAKAKKK